MRPAPDCCLSCPCRLVSCRGLCQRCYGRLCRLVRQGKTTWAELEQAGRCLPAAPQGLGWRGKVAFTRSPTR
jgi:hypothetical protein